MGFDLVGLDFVSGLTGQLLGRAVDVSFDALKVSFRISSGCLI